MKTILTFWFISSLAVAQTGQLVVNCNEPDHTLCRNLKILALAVQAAEFYPSFDYFCIVRIGVTNPAGDGIFPWKKDLITVEKIPKNNFTKKYLIPSHQGTEFFFILGGSNIEQEEFTLRVKVNSLAITIICDGLDKEITLNTINSLHVNAEVLLKVIRQLTRDALSAQGEK